ncbi:MAG: hypothetical protein ACK5QG_16065 [Bacteroidota bacterium]
MTLKADRPWIELAALGVILFFVVKLCLLTGEKGDLMLTIPTAFLVTIGLLATFWTNREYRNYELNDLLKFKGQFRGQREIGIEELKGFKIKERKNTTNIIPFSEFDIIILTEQHSRLTIRQTNYKFDDIKKFKNQLEDKGVVFLGTEDFSWLKSFKDLLTGKIFE